MTKDFQLLTMHYPARPGALPHDPSADPFPGVSGCEGLKRAAVVAIAGGHRMGYFTAPDFPDAALLRTLPRLSWGALPCPCGNFGGGRELECTCSLDEIVAHREILQGALRPQVFAEAHSLPTHYTVHPTEPWANSLAVIRSAQARPVPSVLSRRTGAPELLAHAVAKLQLSDSHRADVLAVAATCARLQGAEMIEACHVAEALQLRVPDSLLPECERAPRG